MGHCRSAGGSMFRGTFIFAFLAAAGYASIISPRLISSLLGHVGICRLCCSVGAFRLASRICSIFGTFSASLL